MIGRRAVLSNFSELGYSPGRVLRTPVRTSHVKNLRLGFSWTEAVGAKNLSLASHRVGCHPPVHFAPVDRSRPMTRCDREIIGRRRPAWHIRRRRQRAARVASARRAPAAVNQRTGSKFAVVPRACHEKPSFWGDGVKNLRLASWPTANLPKNLSLGPGPVRS